MDHSKSNVRLTVLGLLIGILIASMDNTIVSTALGSIVADLGGIDKIAWISSAYMISCVAGMPIYGKLSDMYGRKTFFLIGLSLFMIGSALCGIAENMQQLTAFRAVQGLGGGALMPIAFTIVFDIFPPHERGRMSGLFGAVFGISSICGPLIGAFLTEYINWHWIFYVNIPLGLLALALVVLFYKESLQHMPQRIDWGGAILIVIATVSLMFGLQMGGKEFDWTSWQIITLLSLSVIALLGFIKIESLVPDPIIPLDLFQDRLFATTQAAAFFMGTVFVLFSVYIPFFIQAVGGGSATNAGLILMPMTIASVLGSQYGGRKAIQKSYRELMIISGVLLVVGTSLMSSISAQSSRWLISVYMVMIGLGMGISFPVSQMASTHEMPFQRRATTTSAVGFFRMVGMVMGLTIFGVIQKNLMMQGLQKIAGLASIGHLNNAQSLLQPAVRALIPAPVLSQATTVLANSIIYVFRWSLLAGVLALTAIFLMTNARLPLGAAAPDSELEGSNHVDENRYSGLADGR